ncbi:MAG: Holliday junction resolvase RuvX [Promicromonosporaceae bacterium]|nr:Holliday junction resolvase RuvX [Promicromonosporaceae bacterium]
MVEPVETTGPVVEPTHPVVVPPMEPVVVPPMEPVVEPVETTGTMVDLNPVIDPVVELVETTGPVALPRGARLGVDVGKVRIGIAASDPDGLLAMPVATVERSAGTDAAEIARIAEERGVVVGYLGLPKQLSGADGAATVDARQFARELAEALPDVPLRFIDERLTTVTASANLLAAGRNTRKQRSVIDQQAAVIILQSALDQEKRAGERAGFTVI